MNRAKYRRKGRGLVWPLVFVVGVAWLPGTWADESEQIDFKFELIKADDLLNQEYKTLRASRTKEVRKKLLQDQKQWLADRDTRCKLEGMPETREEWLEEIGKDKQKSEGVTQMTNDRIARLRANQMTPPSVLYTHKVQDKYPPYPEVWGLEFPSPGKGGITFPTVGKMKNGDYVIRYTKKVLKTNPDNPLSIPCEEGKRLAYVEFFASRDHSITCEEYNAFFAKGQKITKAKRTRNIGFDDGSSIRVNLIGGGNCYEPFSLHLEKLDASGKIIARKALLRVADVPTKRYLKESCGGPPGPIIESVSTAKPLDFYDLKDGTFLLVTSLGPLVMRMDKNFYIRYPINTGRYYLVDYDVVDGIRERLKNKYDVSYILYISEEVMKYVETLKHKE